ncbi:MAG TPA: adenylate/guanylate cyclase domain-containing protein [Candidatus Limnocylindrales bacterium]|nr:adenylate/guanylate cyclase domain-containing protein [Candidatus Limnocylindrales bacterium]
MIASLDNGREAARRGEWAAAVDALAAADGEEPLSPDDLELLGTAQWWTGRPDAANEALERAFAGYEAAGRQEDAARVAIYLAYHASRAMGFAVAAGWAAQADRLLEAFPTSPLRAWKGVFETAGALDEGRLDVGVETADRTIAMARELGNDEALYISMAFKGMGEAIAGRWKDGVALLDEASAAALSGRLELRAASDVLCITIGACRNLGDLERAGQWAEASERWMRRNGAGGYPGICRIHRAELKMLHGHWSEAEEDARGACEELQRFHLLDALGLAYKAIGEVRLRMGDLEGAAEAFDRAYEFGDDGQPGLARLQLTQGRIDDARRSIGRALAATVTDGFTDRASRGRLLPTQVEVALAAGDLDTARLAVDELDSIAADFERPLHQAGALTARGELLLGEQKPVEASPVLGRSWRLWQTNDLPYEAAQARLRYAEALAAEGDHDTARRDLVAARKVFEQLGAMRDVRRVDELLEAEGAEAAAVTAGSAAPATTATKTFMFTDIVTSTDLVDVIGDEAWTELLGWHDRELRRSFADHRGEEVNHTGDGFFVAFEQASDALACAVDIQQRLARHRREHGFAPWVRIGLHTAEATRRGRDFSGRGVHIAARVGAAAVREEILATQAVVADAAHGRLRRSEPRRLTLKGVREPVDVVSIDWRSSTG